MKHARFISAACALVSAQAWGQAAPSISSIFPDVNATVGGIGLLYDHRAYGGATALNAQGFSDEDPAIRVPSSDVGISFGIETTLAAMPPGLATLFGPGGSLIAFPFFPGSSFPVLRLVAHKGLGPYVDLGLSGFWFPQMILPFGLWSVGGDLKFMVWHQAEGITVALRSCFSYAYLGFSQSDATSIPGHTLGFAISLRPIVMSQHVVVSKKLSFVEPYIGAAGQAALGGAYIDVTFDGTAMPEQSSSQASQLFSVIAYLGVSIVVPGARISLTPEMTYSSAGIYALGLKTGASF